MAQNREDSSKEKNGGLEMMMSHGRLEMEKRN